MNEINWNAGVKELIPYRSVETETLHYFELDKLVKRFNNGQRTIEGPAPEYKQIKIRSLLEGIVVLPKIEEKKLENRSSSEKIKELKEEVLKNRKVIKTEHQITRKELKEQQEKILSEIDAGNKEIIEELTSRMDKNRLVMLEKIYATIDEISENETEKFLEATQQFLENADLPNKASVKEKINDPKINASAKLKIAIPVWSFINFEAEAGVEWGESIPKLWHKFIDFFKKGV